MQHCSIHLTSLYCTRAFCSPLVAYSSKTSLKRETSETSACKVR
ncbi:hypothetical protein RB213_013885 [Colletotrichum asianum]